MNTKVLVLLAMIAMAVVGCANPQGDTFTEQKSYVQTMRSNTLAELYEGVPITREKIAKSAIATVDIPNIGSIRVLEKLGFLLVKQIHAYGSDDMYLYRRDLVQC